MDRKKLLKNLLFLILFIFIVNFIANKFYWHSSIWYFDMIMHFLGGFWIVLASLYFFSPQFLSPVSFQSIFKILLLVFFIGIGWEAFEILVDRAITQNTFNVLDIGSDIFFDLAGGVFAILYFLKRIMLQSKDKGKDNPWGNSFKDCP